MHPLHSDAVCGVCNRLFTVNPIHTGCAQDGFLGLGHRLMYNDLVREREKAPHTEVVTTPAGSTAVYTGGSRE
jgi:hypothetical protein